MKKYFSLCVMCIIALCACNNGNNTAVSVIENIPLPEHPRPDFERTKWMNLNGYWNFTFDESIAKESLTSNSSTAFDKKILVPFPWGSKLSEVENDGDIAWYGRSVTIPKSWKGKRIFLVIGASDWETKAWFDGKELGTHQGGYTPFEFELTDGVQFGKNQQITLRVDDVKNNAHLYGKQGYGDARGIWQTVYLEARGETYIKYVHFTPDIDNSKVRVEVALNGQPAENSEFNLSFKTGGQKTFTGSISSDNAKFDIAIENQHLWNLDDPFLYEVTAAITNGGKTIDEVNSYFGQRKIGTATLPGTEYTYITLNNKPLYLQTCLDQSYHPEGFYTFPSDDFMKNEIMISKNLGLNGNRVHIKVEVPRKLYWADKLGLLIMADTPNFWGEPVPAAQKDWEHCMRNQVERDYNHPCIFAWVNFNETWGLFTNIDEKKREYTKETQEWVRSMYKLTKSLDPSRLVEDNSACNHDHVQTDINSWHNYNAGYNWEKQVEMYDKGTYEGSEFNYIGGNKQGREPMINSECGNVWGYERSAGDCDYTWDYHCMMNAFRHHPKVAGWLYTEHHDVINEWNGYVKYDRSPKIDGLSDLVEGMTIKDFHSLYYIVPMRELCTDVTGGSNISIPIFASFMTDKNPGKMTLSTKLVGWNQIGDKNNFDESSMDISFEEYLNKEIGNLNVSIPKEKGLYLLQMILKNDKNDILHRNFCMFRVKNGQDLNIDKTKTVTFAPSSFTAQEWSIKQAAVLGGLKENGFGNGYFEYKVTIPAGCKVADLASATLVFEASAKQLFGKDMPDGKDEGDFMLGKGTHDPCKVPNAYAMTDENLWKSKVNITVNGKDAGSFDLADDPADHRGILSWHAQPREKLMYEAGSYGYLIKAELPLDALKDGQPVTIRFSVPADVNDGKGGLAIYGKDFGRYPLDPTVLFTLK